MWRRALAGAIDFFLVPAFALLLMLVTGVLESAEAYSRGFPYFRVFFLGVASYLMLNGWLLWQRGQTLGKYWLKLKIVNSQDGKKVALWKLICLRAVFFGLPHVALIGFWYLVLIDWFFLFGKDRRCLHDLVAGTLVAPVTELKPVRPAD
jgi:uncharacterized RDD family membrane protein YckC|tara:strand:- start:885 stop:1334 length:450 start_codon:yes stop_codon:yes gene_type:complete